MDGTGSSVTFGNLVGADLVVDRYYYGGRAGHAADDPIARLLPVGNSGGFRFSGSPSADTVRLAVLLSTGREPDWPDLLDVRSGTLMYFGDNRSPGHGLHETRKGGNAFLRDIFQRAHGTRDDRRLVPPLFLFTNAGVYRDVLFRGLLAPGSVTTQADDDLEAIWRSRADRRFQNYRARFSILDVHTITRAWIDEILAGEPLGRHCPEVWRRWVEGRAYQTLTTKSEIVMRDRSAQTPADPEAMGMVTAIHEWFKERPTDFEPCAVEIWRMIAPNTGPADVTRQARDGGRDAIGDYNLGPMGDTVALDFALEAKCYHPSNAVGVRETSRLISRIRHRMFGVLVTTSFVEKQAYTEIRTDGHPIVIVSGRDIAEALRSHGYTTRAAVRSWLAQRFPHESSTPTTEVDTTPGSVYSTDVDTSTYT